MAVGNGDDRKFVTTEPLEDKNVCGQKAWDAVRIAFANRNCVGYWRYPLFSRVGQVRKEPDVVIAERELGICILEVVSATIEQIVTIKGDSWEFQNIDFISGSPSERCKSQLQALISNCDREPSIFRKVTGRAIIILPLVTEEQWQQKGFDKLPGCPPVVFQNFLSKEKLLQKIQQSTPAIQGVGLDDEQWETLLAVLGGTSVLRRPPRTISNTQKSGVSRSSIIATLQERLYELDLQQVHIGTEIPPGAQRIRGIAGSGKTVLLCQKAAHMHLKHPDWNIALVFFTRSLYDQIESLIDRWIRHFSNGESSYDYRAKQKLRVLHAWGARDQPGLYGEIAKYHNKTRGAVVKGLAPNEGLAYRCKELLEDLGEIEPIFDAILIDEGQDLVIDQDSLKYQEKQTIYWLAYQALKPIEPDSNERRLIWAYDEAQSLDNLVIPTAPSLFGEGFKRMVSGTHKGGIKKSEIMHRCYRTPGQILTAAHAIGMGLLRPDGMVSGITDAKQWKAIGYEVTGEFRSGREITLHRPPKNSPNLVPQLWGKPVLEFLLCDSRDEELDALVNNIKLNLKQDGLKPSREILVVVLGSTQEAMKLESEVAQFLIDCNIDVYIPSAPRLNSIRFDWRESQPNRFWHDGGITVSRIHRAKGNEADMVYVIGCDNVAKDEANVGLRNQLFVALTRARGWAVLSGIEDYPMYQEIQNVLDSGDTFKFTFRKAPQRSIDDDDATSVDVPES
jgi:superfamily I DNA and RNA helicase